jgi:hypothetical protein
MGRPHRIEVPGGFYHVHARGNVVLNPVRSAGVQRPEHWRCISARATLGLDPAPAWPDVDFVLGYFGATPEKARPRFNEFLLDGIGRSITVPGTDRSGTDRSGTNRRAPQLTP